MWGHIAWVTRKDTESDETMIRIERLIDITETNPELDAILAWKKGLESPHGPGE